MPTDAVSPRSQRTRKAVLALTATGVLACGLAASADADIYWANGNTTETIGRANEDGTGVDNSFVSAADGACGVAVDANYVYWTGGSGEGHVGRAPLNGGPAEEEFITTANDLPCGVAVNSTHVFWDNYILGAIGRANVDGTGINNTFITGGSNPQMPVVTSTHIYWDNKDGESIARANLDGTNVEQDFIPTECTPVGVAVNDTHIYWANTYCGSIGRANLDGTNVDQDFIPNSGGCGLAVDESHIYLGNFGSPTLGYVGRANLDGTGLDLEFIQTAGNTCGVAVDPPAPPPPPANTFKVEPRVSCANNCHVILVKITFDSAGHVIGEQVLAPDQRMARGTIASKKPKLVKRLSKAVTAGENKLKLKLTAAGKRALKKKGKLRLKMRFTFTPTGGTPKSLVRTLKVKLPKGQQ